MTSFGVTAQNGWNLQRKRLAVRGDRKSRGLSSLSARLFVGLPEHLPGLAGRVLASGKPRALGPSGVPGTLAPSQLIQVLGCGRDGRGVPALLRPLPVCARGAAERPRPSSHGPLVVILRGSALSKLILELLCFLLAASSEPRGSVMGSGSFSPNCPFRISGGARRRGARLSGASCPRATTLRRAWTR